MCLSDVRKMVTVLRYERKYGVKLLHKLVFAELAAKRKRRHKLKEIYGSLFSNMKIMSFKRRSPKLKQNFL